MKIIAFFACSVFLVIVSHASLRQPRSHGFYRFLAWEAILVLFLLNVDVWFREPFAWHQLLSWILLFGSLVPLVFGVRALWTRGKPSEQRAGNPSLLAFEKTTTLVTTGVYHYIRHPLYSSLLLLGWGIFFKLPSLPGLAITAVATTFLFATAQADENECIQFFGAQYQEYMKHSKRFIPFLF